MKVGVIVSNPGEDETLIPEVSVATKVRSSSFWRLKLAAAQQRLQGYKDKASVK